MQRRRWLGAAAAAAAVVLLALFKLAKDSRNLLSSEACRMSWMSPSYVHQVKFNETWTPLARRYSLWLYREVGWETGDELHGRPVLFIPGNAGSSRQIRSIASSATRQYYANPYQVSWEFAHMDNAAALDVFAVEFNEDFSALHAPTILAQQEYTRRALAYISTLYPSDTQVIVIGHSMGGVVAVSLLPSTNISAVITLSTPHTLPPAPLDRQIEEVYSRNLIRLRTDPAPIVSICGGAQDHLVSSEACVLPSEHGAEGRGYRRTVLTTALEHAWTSVGHQVIVWCHQVRWRVARAALELSASRNLPDGVDKLKKWLDDGYDPPEDPHPYDLPNLSHFKAVVLKNKRFQLSDLRDRRTMMLQVPQGVKEKEMVLYASNKAQVTVSLCNLMHKTCRDFSGPKRRLLPPPALKNGSFLGYEGIDDDAYVTVFRLDVTPGGQEEAVILTTEGSGSDSWVMGGFLTPPHKHIIKPSFLQLLLGHITVELSPHTLATDIQIKNLPETSLIVYRIDSTLGPTCADASYPPVLLHHGSSFESHFHSLLVPARLHSDASGPYLPNKPRNVTITIYSSGECSIHSFTMTIDMKASLARMALRYWILMAAWAFGVASVIFASGWSQWERTGSFPCVEESLATYISYTFPRIAFAIFILGCLPVGKEWFLLGTGGGVILALLGPFLLALASGLVLLSWLALYAAMLALSRIPFAALVDRAALWLPRRLYLRSQVNGDSKADPLTQTIYHAIFFVMIAILLPHQVAFVCVYLVHLLASSRVSSPSSSSDVELDMVQKLHLLLLLSWVLPVTAPALAVWGRAIAGAGIGAFGSGWSDQDVFGSLGIFALVEFGTRNSQELFSIRPSWIRRLALRTLLFLISAVVFLAGGRRPWISFLAVKALCFVLVADRIGVRFWREPRRHQVNGRI